MIALRRKLRSKFETGRGMYGLIRSTSNDLNKVLLSGVPLSRLPLADYFALVKNIQYRQDPKPREIIARPAHLLKYKDSGLDCKKKAILISSWAKENRIPFRLVATSRRKDRRVHHVYPELKIAGRFIPVDATYPDNRINQKKTITKKIVLNRGKK